MIVQPKRRAVSIPELRVSSSRRRRVSIEDRGGQRQRVSCLVARARRKGVAIG